MAHLNYTILCKVITLVEQDNNLNSMTGLSCKCQHHLLLLKYVKLIYGKSDFIKTSKIFYSSQTCGESVTRHKTNKANNCIPMYIIFQFCRMCLIKKKKTRSTASSHTFPRDSHCLLYNESLYPFNRT